MRSFIITALSLASVVLAQNCGPNYNNQVCDAGKCCRTPNSRYTGQNKLIFNYRQPVRMGTSITTKTHPSRMTPLTNPQCDAGADYCDPASCLKPFSGPGSSCSSTATTLTTLPISQPTSTGFPSAVPEIDVCGAAVGGVTCPGVGANGYFYRCCSTAGHWCDINLG
jgi:hypothetical protein